MSLYDWRRQAAAHALAIQGVRKLRARQRELQAELNRRRANGEGLDDADYCAVLHEFEQVAAAANHALMSADHAADVGWSGMGGTW